MADDPILRRLFPDPPPRVDAAVLPELAGRLSGFALRVPALTGSITDLTITASRDTDADEVNQAYRAAAAGSLTGVLTVNDDPIVSSDIVGNPASCILDAPLTAVEGRTVKVLGWYDNGVGIREPDGRHGHPDRVALTHLSLSHLSQPQRGACVGRAAQGAA